MKTEELSGETQVRIHEMRTQGYSDTFIAMHLGLPLEWLASQPMPPQRRMGEADDEFRDRIRQERGTK